MDWMIPWFPWRRCVVKIRMTAVAALALAAACGGSTPPENGPAPRDPGQGAPVMLGPGVGGSGPNVFALIGQRERLALTGPQVVELDSIGRAWSLVNDSVQRELRGRGGERTPIEAVRPLLLRMADNNETANRAVEAVLNDEQRRIACTLQPPQAQGEVRRPAGGAAGAGAAGRPHGRPARHAPRLRAGGAHAPRLAMVRPRRPGRQRPLREGSPHAGLEPGQGMRV
jgi:hypothetical protein